MNRKANASIGKKLVRGFLLVVVFIATFASLLLAVAAFTGGRESFYKEYIDTDEVRDSVFAMVERYLQEKSNQTTVPMEVLQQGYDREDIDTLVAQYAQATVNFLFDGEEYPNDIAYEMCDFAPALDALAESIIADGIYRDSEIENLYAEVDLIAEDSVEYIDRATNVLNLSSLEDWRLMKLASPILRNIRIILINAALLTLLMAYLSWMHLYKENRSRGAYATFGSMWLASGVVFSIAYAFQSLAIYRRLPIDTSSPMYTALVGMFREFEETFMDITSYSFYGLSAVLLIATIVYVALMKKPVEEDPEYKW